jgi:hypothetical protein
MTRRRQWRPPPRGRLLAFALLAASVVAAPALAKEDVQATLTAPLPLDAAPGDEIRVVWTLESVDDDGTRQPFGASGIYVRLFSAADGEPTIGPATGGGGRYEATVVVPEGGIGGVQIGLQGWVSNPTGTHPSDVFFPITNNPLPPVTDTTPAAAATEPAPAETSSGMSPLWIVPLALALLAALGGAAVLVRRRRHPAAAA